jgi:thiosulfate dehydrogenase
MNACPRALFWIAFVAAAVVLGACGSGVRSRTQPGFDPRTVPAGPVGEQIKFGRDIMMYTASVLPHNVAARMSCAACHLNGGTVAGGGSLVGTYAQFPQWNQRAHRVIALQDRLAECFLYSMNGKPPAYHSKAMIALVAYIAWLSRGTPTFSTPHATPSDALTLPRAAPNVANGSHVYASSCSRCHGANGAGFGPIPPLWGATSFNGGAGMAHLKTMTGFVRRNMPEDKPGSLSVQDAYDVSAYVLSHARPKFHSTAPIVSSPEPARYF